MCAAFALMRAALAQMVRDLALICAAFVHKIDAMALMYAALAFICAALADIVRQGRRFAAHVCGLGAQGA